MAKYKLVKGELVDLFTTSQKDLSKVFFEKILGSELFDIKTSLKQKKLGVKELASHLGAVEKENIRIVITEGEEDQRELARLMGAKIINFCAEEIPLEGTPFIAMYDTCGKLFSIGQVV